MTRDELMQMAEEAELVFHGPAAPVQTRLLERFAALVAAHEREQCAKIVSMYGHSLVDGEVMAERIRARKS